MDDYRFACRHNDGCWHFLKFQSDDDDVAVAHGLRIRTANTCELYRGNHLLATFDEARAFQVEAISKTGSRMLEGVL